jgi:hypothetical protein
LILIGYVVLGLPLEVLCGISAAYFRRALLAAGIDPTRCDLFLGRWAFASPNAPRPWAAEQRQDIER